MARGYFDLQVNGYVGADFHSDELTIEQMHYACEAMQAEGVRAVLATITTAPIEHMLPRLKRMACLREQDELIRRMVAGIHIEGPFLNPEDGYRGAHARDALRPADLDAMSRMLDAADGLTKLVTLAPEVDQDMRVTRFVARQNIRVSAGHTNASMDQLHAAIDAGISMFTHLGNGCPMQMHRHDNIIQRALSLSDRLWLMFIADGAHVTYPALRNYIKAAGIERSIVVTDALSAAGMGVGRYKTARWDVMVGEDLVVRAPDGSHLVGSAMPMSQAFGRLIEHVGLSASDAERLTCLNPREAMGLPLD